jgi:hypothetical protein
MDVAALAAGIPWTFHVPSTSRSRPRGRINFAAYIGHTALRLFVMGDDAYERTATEEECAGMQDVLRDAMHAGAAGFATSFAFPHRGIDGKPVPSRFANRAELEALLDTMGEVGLGVVSIAPGDPCPPADMFDLQIKAGVPFTWGALLTSPGRNHQQALDMNRRMGTGGRGLPQVTPARSPSCSRSTRRTRSRSTSTSPLQNASIDERFRATPTPLA